MAASGCQNRSSGGEFFEWLVDQGGHDMNRLWKILLIVGSSAWLFATAGCLQEYNGGMSILPNMGKVWFPNFPLTT